MQRMADIFARAIVANVAATTQRPTTAQHILPAPRVRRIATVIESNTNGRDMQCRIKGCTNRSKGPRMGYICEEHLSLPKRVRKKAAEEYKKQHAKAA